jgi:thioredoxin reductase (NADPH)
VADFVLSDAGVTSNTRQNGSRYELIIIGGGPAGLTAGIYAGRAGLKTLLLTGPGPGGQVSITDIVENFPGFPDGISGAELADRTRRQAERFGTVIENEAVIRVDFTAHPFTVETETATYRPTIVIVATGAVPRLLGVPGESEFLGRGVSTCATCDGFFFRDKRVVVVGGGDSAIDEGLFLTRFAREVVIVHRRDRLRATQIYQDRAASNPRVRLALSSVVERILGDKTVTGVQVRNVSTGEVSVIDTDGVFLYVGMQPSSDLFVGQLELDEDTYIVADSRQHTSVPGVFAAGDVQSPEFRQVIVAAASGAVAAVEAERFLGELQLRTEH